MSWRILSKLQESAIAKADAPKSLVTHVGVAAAIDHPGQPVLLWTIEVTDAEGETTRVDGSAATPTTKAKETEKCRTYS
jgi:hypothetical protein